MTVEQLIGAVEACLFAGGEPISAARLAQAIETDEKTVAKGVELLNERLSERKSALEVRKLEDAYQLCTRREAAPYVKNLLEIRRNTPLSPSSMETLAIIAYNQPVTKSLIDQVRGVDSYYAISSLCEKGLVQEADRLNIPGRPITYVTTPQFLRCFSLSSLEELVPAKEILSLPEDDGLEPTEE